MYPYQMNQSGLLKVNGIEGARAYQMMPNSTVALFDANDDLFYVKNSDAGGFATIKAYKFTPCENQDNPAFVTRDEFERFKGELRDAVKSIRESTANKQFNNQSGKKPNEQPKQPTDASGNSNDAWR